MINITKIVTNILTDSFIYINIKKVHRLQILKKHGRHFYCLTWEKCKRFPRVSAGLKIMQFLMDFFGGGDSYSDFVYDMRLLSPYYFKSPGLVLQLCCDN